MYFKQTLFLFYMLVKFKNKNVFKLTSLIMHLFPICKWKRKEKYNVDKRIQIISLKHG